MDYLHAFVRLFGRFLFNLVFYPFRLAAKGVDAGFLTFVGGATLSVLAGLVLMSLGIPDPAIQSMPPAVFYSTLVICSYLFFPPTLGLAFHTVFGAHSNLRTAIDDEVFVIQSERFAKKNQGENP